MAKPFPTPKGDLQRGLEVIEYCIGAPQMLKGEFTDSAGPGIDMYSMRQPLGVVASIMPFNFPAMMPLWHVGPALACGNAVVLKPSERDPSVPLMLAELFRRGRSAEGACSRSSMATKKLWIRMLDSEDHSGRVSFVGSTPIAQYIYSRATANGKRAQCFGGAKEPHDRHARRRFGSGRRCSGRCRLRRSGRTLHGCFRRGSGR